MVSQFNVENVYNILWKHLDKFKMDWMSIKHWKTF